MSDRPKIKVRVLPGKEHVHDGRVLTAGQGFEIRDGNRVKQLVEKGIIEILADKKTKPTAEKEAK